ncbi:MBOAT family O-acyltransferase [uncultured Negativibacillus sp.]|uniref:MBOAT family O-acyltransferase n=1 Tax=uncultured Negativibacillus sp. TaxID=1980696 RepID=UPI0025D44D97|nr:MBOAT family O-acyltransferase [uncultured Negativibacillus sp.]
MVFSSLLFLFRFLPITFLIYYLAPTKLKNTVLFLASLFFYTWGEPKFFPIMLVSIAVNYVAGLLMERFDKKEGVRRACFWIAFAITLGFLLFFKYTNFFLSNINALLGTSLPLLSSSEFHLPLGISFYTFQIMAYTIDVYRRKIKVEHNLIDFGTFVVLFPQLIAGPIVLYSDISRELKHRKITLEQINDGAGLFIMGLASKILLADTIGALWTEVQTLGFANVSTPLAWMGLLAYSFQIYFDFSGYSLMAIGLGRMLGFFFPQNFNYPYISKSVTEFWRRWHITLSSWFREYVYIPLGGNRVGRARHFFNIFAVWFLTGFWHGANWNFIFWGLYFFVLLMIEKIFLLKRLEKSRILSHVYLIFFVMIGWALFALSDLSALGELLQRLFSLNGGNDWMYYLRDYAGMLILCVLASTPFFKVLADSRLGKNRVVRTVFLSVVLLVSVAFMVDSTYSPFLYFNF